MNDQTQAPTTNRRTILRSGTLAAASAAFLAACGKTNTTVTRLGATPTTVKLADETVTDVALLRTAMSVETMIAGILSDPAVTSVADSKFAPIAASFVAAHKSHLAPLRSLIAARGGEAYEDTNAKLMTAYGQAAIDLVKSGNDPKDVPVLTMALENLAAATYQYFVSLTNEAALRAEMMKVGAMSSRRAAVVAQLINPGTGAFAPSVDEQGVATVSALPSAFGALSSIQVTLGPVNPETGTRPTILMDTPSLNSIIY